MHEEKTYRVFVGCLNRSGPLLKEIDWLSVEAIPEFSLTSFYDVNFVRQLWRCSNFIKRNNINIVHTHDFYTNIFGMGAAYLAGVPARIASKRETFTRPKLQTIVEGRAFRLAARIVANAEAVKKSLVNAGVPEFKVSVIHNGLDVRRLSPTFKDRPKGLISMGLESLADMQIVTIVANMDSDVKNHRMFLRAAARVKLEVEKTAFVLAGEGSLTNSLKSYAQELGIDHATVFTGRCGHVGDLLSVSDICVLSSRSEGFSNSLLEYMSAGKPVVATRVGGAEEVVIENETGFLIDSDDDKEMAQKIVELLRDGARARRLGNRGREWIESEFTLDKQLSKTLKVYEEVFIGGKESLFVGDCDASRSA